MICRKLYYQIKIVSLNLCLVSGSVPDNSTAPFTSVNNYIATLWIRLGAGGTKYSAAGVCPVSGIYINVKRAKAKRAMISRGIAQGQYLFTAILANKAVIVF